MFCTLIFCIKKSPHALLFFYKIGNSCESECFFYEYVNDTSIRTTNFAKYFICKCMNNINNKTIIMKSMKNLKFWSLLIGLVFGSLAFVACGDDDDDNSNNPTPTPTPPTNILLGKWSKSTVIPGGENQTQGKYYAVVTNSYEFKSDMTFESSTSSVTIYEKADPAEQFSLHNRHLYF